MNREITTIKEPPLKKILRVDRDGFGYMDPTVDKEYLETVFLRKCIGSYVRKGEFQALAHIYQMHAEKVSKFLEYVKSRNLNDGDFDAVYILRSGSADIENIDITYKALKKVHSKKIEVINGVEDMHVIFDRRGKMYWVDPKTIQKEVFQLRDTRDFDVLTLQLFPEFFMCENNREIVYPDKKEQERLLDTPMSELKAMD